MSRCACMTGDEASGPCVTCPYNARVRATAVALHEWMETNFVNKGMRRKFSAEVVDQASYLEQASDALAAADAVSVPVGGSRDPKDEG